MRVISSILSGLSFAVGLLFLASIFMQNSAVQETAAGAGATAFFALSGLLILSGIASKVDAQAQDLAKMREMYRWDMEQRYRKDKFPQADS